MALIRMEPDWRPHTPVAPVGATTRIIHHCHSCGTAHIRLIGVRRAWWPGACWYCGARFNATSWSVRVSLRGITAPGSPAPGRGCSR